jgi:transposase-like protein
MSEHNDKSEQEAGEEQDVKRWTAKRRAALVVELLSGKTTIAEAARAHDLKVSDIELWKDTFLASGENALRSNPRDELEQIDQLHRKVGDLTMEVEVLKFARNIVGLPPCAGELFGQVSQEFPTLSQRKLCAMLELNRSTLWKQAAKPVEQKKGSKTQPQDLCEVIELRPALDDEALVVEKMRAVVLAHP